MTYQFRSIKEARQHLLDSGFVSIGYGALTGAEMYQAGSVIASIRKVPFKGYRVRVGY